MEAGEIKIEEKMSHMLSECCSAPPLTNTDIHDGIAMCNACKEWSGFYDEEEEDHDCMITYWDKGAIKTIKKKFPFIDNNLEKQNG